MVSWRFLVVVGCVSIALGCSEEAASGGAAGSGAVGGSGDAGGATGGTAGQSGAGSGGGAGSGAAPSCDEACSGRGTCVRVDGAATCACARGYYAVGTSCLEDPCEAGGSCFYVDAQTGSDSGDGSASEPWKSIEKVQAEAAGLAAGSYVLFRRGRDWSDADLTISGVSGTEAQPITFGAYGPLDAARPKFRRFDVRKSNHVAVRDIESSHSEQGPCITITESGYVTVSDVFVHDCQNNGIYFGDATHHGTIADATITNIPNNDAISIHNPGTMNEQTKLGDHFWVIDNYIPGPVAEEPIDIATGDDTFAGSRDIKIVGNLTARGGTGCITTGHGTSVAWIIGNTLGICPTKETSAALSVGGYHGPLSGNHYQIRGNLIFQNVMSNLILSDPENLPEVVVDQNTIVTLIGQRPAWTHTEEQGKVVFTRNVVVPTGGNAHVHFLSDPLGVLAEQDQNWFVPGSKPGCVIGGKTLSAWQGDTGLDQGSSCATIPGLSEPSEAQIDDTAGWRQSEFLGHFVPAADWPGCADAIGAFDCDGKRRIRFEPMPGYDEGGGLGWRGPLIARQRYPLD